MRPVRKQPIWLPINDYVSDVSTSAQEKTNLFNIAQVNDEETVTAKHEKKQPIWLRELKEREKGR